MERFEEAVAHDEEALRLQPNLAVAHSNWGIVLLRMGQLEEAVSHFREALRIDPD